MDMYAALTFYINEHERVKTRQDVGYIDEVYK